MNSGVTIGRETVAIGKAADEGPRVTVNCIMGVVVSSAVNELVQAVKRQHINPIVIVSKCFMHTPNCHFG
jgi:hypothetical protein